MFYYKAHPHTQLSLPAVETLSTNPILFSQIPSLDNLVAKLASFVDAVTPIAGGRSCKGEALEVISHLSQGSVPPCK